VERLVGVRCLQFEPAASVLGVCLSRKGRLRVPRGSASHQVCVLRPFWSLQDGLRGSCWTTQHFWHVRCTTFRVAQSDVSRGWTIGQQGL